MEFFVWEIIEWPIDLNGEIIDLSVRINGDFLVIEFKDNHQIFIGTESIKGIDQFLEVRDVHCPAGRE